MDSRGRVMWDRVMGLLDQSEREANRMTEDPYADLKQHRLTPETLAKLAVVPRKIQKRRQHFVRCRGLGSSGWGKRPGNIIGWPCTCCTCTGKAAASPPAPQRYAAMEGVTRFAKWRALAELEELGLVSVKAPQSVAQDHRPL